MSRGDQWIPSYCAVLANRLKQLRADSGLTLMEVTERTRQLQEQYGETMDSADETEPCCGVDISILSRLENGETYAPQAHNLLWLADLYGVSLDYLLGRTEDLGVRRYRPPKGKKAS